MTAGAVLQSETRLRELGFDPSDFLTKMAALPSLELNSTDIRVMLRTVSNWDADHRGRLSREGSKLRCPNCGEQKTLRFVGKTNIDRDVGLHFPVEQLVDQLARELPNVSWDSRVVTVACRTYFKGLEFGCEVDIIACEACNLRYANTRWRERSLIYQNSVVRDGVQGMYGRANSRHFVRYKASIAGYICEALGPIHGMNVLDIGCAEGILTWQLWFAGATVTGVEVSPTAQQYAKRVMGLRRIVAQPYTIDLFEEASFDRIVTHHVIEHVVGFDEFIAAMAHHLKPGGLVLLQCPIANHSHHAVSLSHPVGLTAGLLTQSFRRHGLRIKLVERFRAGASGNSHRMDPDTGTSWSGIVPNCISIIAERP
jgi:2-polyprenyl-3-methyl-5-hydroxy-6-metoxy-1,4-benzoquinol methylase